MDNGLGFRQRHKQNHPQKLPLLSHASSVILIGVMFLVFTVWWQRVFDYVSLCFYWDDSCPGVLFIFFSCCLFLAGHLALRQIFRQTEVIWKSALKPRITRGLKYTSSIGRLNLELTLLQQTISCPPIYPWMRWLAKLTWLKHLAYPWSLKSNKTVWSSHGVENLWPAHVLKSQQWLEALKREVKEGEKERESLKNWRQSSNFWGEQWANH